MMGDDSGAGKRVTVQDPKGDQEGDRSNKTQKATATQGSAPVGASATVTDVTVKEQGAAQTYECVTDLELPVSVDVKKALIACKMQEDGDQKMAVDHGAGAGTAEDEVFVLDNSQERVHFSQNEEVPDSQDSFQAKVDAIQGGKADSETISSVNGALDKTGGRIKGTRKCERLKGQEDADRTLLAMQRAEQKNTIPGNTGYLVVIDDIWKELD
ncbi:uncharacterized protein LOC100837104 isoform X3 [Brachypodium distachyon]|uniref:uncharacterized protein LOC100837104 isoform X3 n=1 Tax=Brachypodium distachyon TaxID=15368 RepID=UPI000D0D0238|nr:uncharacterized protein LOC100837104 isoform X3 [Brachypodium distachyon]|eukprot:XP_024319125.1 uncharacterized protein LOC100837104 isoform X3 [Brachypodium distachyon]